jgi:hypothetical protein
VARSPRPVLWTVFYGDGRFVGLTIEGRQDMTLPLFSSPAKAIIWIEGMEQLGALVISRPLYPKVLLDVLYRAEEAGYESITLDPPWVNTLPAEVGTLENLIDQAEAYA